MWHWGGSNAAGCRHRWAGGRGWPAPTNVCHRLVGAADTHGRMRIKGESMRELPISGSYRPTVMGMEGMVASGHYLASLAAQRILDRGGNAIDAGLAAGLCTCVLQIDMVDLAGVAPIIIYLAEEDRVVTISGLGRWPQAASVEYFQKHHGGRIPVGVE